jgi:hypothetical protein
VHGRISSGIVQRTYAAENPNVFNVQFLLRNS